MRHELAVLNLLVRKDVWVRIPPRARMSLLDDEILLGGQRLARSGVGGYAVTSDCIRIGNIGVKRPSPQERSGSFAIAIVSTR